jgi:nucleotide-binding universal stress UspA family protein
MLPLRTVLVAADFSESSREAFRFACSLSREGTTSVLVFHVVEPRSVAEQPVYLGDRTVHFTAAPPDRAHLEALRERLREAYVPERAIDVEYRVKEGHPVEELLRLEQDPGWDLIVLGTRGRTGLRHLLAGSVAEKVLRGARCPVLALRSRVQHAQSAPISTVLHPTDFSELSRSALKVSRELARDLGARLVLLHIATPEVGFPEVGPFEVAQQEDRDTLEDMRAQLDGPDLKEPIEVEAVRGEVVPEILRAAETRGCDLIVMGTHGRTGLSRLLMGGVAEAVLRRAPCPVLIVRPIRPEPQAVGHRSHGWVSIF